MEPATFDVGSGINTESDTSKKRKRAWQACDHCRARKIRCNGETADTPCPNCIDRGVDCVTTISQRRRRRPIGTTANIFNHAQPVPSLTDSMAMGHSPLCPYSTLGQSEETTASIQVDDDGGETPDDLRERSSVLPSDMTNWEYHGPRSFLSVCSKPAVKWVSEQTGRADFADIASYFASDITRRLKMDADISPTRAPEPDAETAWQYTEAYFTLALDASLAALHRPCFERQLAAHLAGNAVDNSPTWHALRNVVYAFGCRIELSKNCSFKDASQQAWLYFENALAVYARLLFYKTSIMGVQVLTLMAYYTQNIGTPCLEYMLSSDAVRLAFAKGLHRAAPLSQGLTEQDVEQRNRIFWAIYCLEKQIACQASRPSIIDDEEVTCSLPRITSPSDDAFSIAYCHSLIRISRALSTIEKRLSAVRCSRMDVTATVQTVDELHSELETVKNAPQNQFGLALGTKIDVTNSPEDFKLDQLVHLHYAYHTAMLNVHTIWSYPWIRALVGLSAIDKLRDYVLRSSDVVARVSRDMIAITEHIHFKAHATVPVAFFAPIYAMISLFVYCLDRQKSLADLAVMDIGTGYFSKLGLETDFLISVPFVRAITSLAYGFEESTLATNLHNHQHLAQGGMNASQSLGADFWNVGILDAETMVHLEDWSTFPRIL
ncbi:ABC-transporter-regulating transcription factor [Fulvia fulva]|nr:ABC-transporter-regulating transcription factor [Fulvia fulva]WPV15632.1 ABC-transporter-regulating transcription factor [Fulvia fulva]